VLLVPEELVDTALPELNTALDLIRIKLDLVSNQKIELKRKF
jgi:hypothetical protein